jgi:GNAT superfamily N-acetyltransferase
MTDPRFTRVLHPARHHQQAIQNALDAFSDPRAGGTGDWPAHDLCFVLRDAAGGILGGLWGRCYYDWLFVELLFVPEILRGQGLGTALLGMAEAEARLAGAVGLWLDTFSFQARDFYEQKGYRIFGEIAEYPPGHKRLFLSRLLDPTGPVRMTHPGVERIASPAPEQRAAISDALAAFNEGKLGGDAGPDEALCFTIEDAAGHIVGGLWGRSYYRWLHIDVIFVPEAQRGQGLGTALLRAAEAEAAQRGCIGLWLDSFTFQAPQFYPRHGFREFGALPNYPGEHRRHFFAKRID